MQGLAAEAEEAAAEGERSAADAEAGQPVGDWAKRDDPIYRDELWLLREQVRCPALPAPRSLV